jgi:hypothetical protein
MPMTVFAFGHSAKAEAFKSDAEKSMAVWLTSF